MELTEHTLLMVDSEKHQVLEGKQNSNHHNKSLYSQPVEFSHAIEYVKKIKSRFSAQPDKYKKFLEIFHYYQSGHHNQKTPLCKQRIELEIYSQMATLLGNQEDLLAEFAQLLPDVTAAPTTDHGLKMPKHRARAQRHHLKKPTSFGESSQTNKEKCSKLIKPPRRTDLNITLKNLVNAIVTKEYTGKTIPESGINCTESNYVDRNNDINNGGTELFMDDEIRRIRNDEGVHSELSHKDEDIKSIEERNGSGVRRRRGNRKVFTNTKEEEALTVEHRIDINERTSEDVGICPSDNQDFDTESLTEEVLEVHYDDMRWEKARESEGFVCHRKNYKNVKSVLKDHIKSTTQKSDSCSNRAKRKSGLRSIRRGNRKILKVDESMAETDNDMFEVRHDIVENCVDEKLDSKEVIGECDMNKSVRSANNLDVNSGAGSKHLKKSTLNIDMVEENTSLREIGEGSRVKIDKLKRNFARRNTMLKQTTSQISDKEKLKQHSFKERNGTDLPNLKDCVVLLERVNMNHTIKKSKVENEQKSKIKLQSDVKRKKLNKRKSLAKPNSLFTSSTSTNNALNSSVEPEICEISSDSDAGVGKSEMLKSQSKWSSAWSPELTLSALLARPVRPPHLPPERLASRR